MNGRSIHKIHTCSAALGHWDRSNSRRHRTSVSCARRYWLLFGIILSSEYFHDESNSPGPLNMGLSFLYDWWCKLAANLVVYVNRTALWVRTHWTINTRLLPGEVKMPPSHCAIGRDLQRNPSAAKDQFSPSATTVIKTTTTTTTTAT